METSELGRVGDFQTVSSGEVSVQESDRRGMGCMSILQGGKPKLSCAYSPVIPWEGEEVPIPFLQACRHHPQWETVWIITAKSKTCRVKFPVGKGERLRVGTFKV